MVMRLERPWGFLYWTRKLMRPSGLTRMPKPLSDKSHTTVSLAGLGSLSRMRLLTAMRLGSEPGVGMAVTPDVSTM